MARFTTLAAFRGYSAVRATRTGRGGGYGNFQGRPRCREAGKKAALQRTAIRRWQQRVLGAQSCPTLYDPVDLSPPGSSVHGILQARILQWVAISSPGDHPEPRSPALRADALPSELRGKPRREATEVTDSKTKARGRVLIKHSDGNLK